MGNVQTDRGFTPTPTSLLGKFGCYRKYLVSFFDNRFRLKSEVGVSSTKAERGFIALISAVIITTVLLTFVVSVGASGFFTRFTILGSEFKEISQAVAEGCAHTAILKKSQDSSYGGNETIKIDGKDCNIENVTSSNAQVQGVYKNSYTNYVVQFNSSTFDIINWQEVGNFP